MLSRFVLSRFVLEIVAYAVIGFFFKTMAFKSDDGAETCSSPGGTWEAYCKKADLTSPDPCAFASNGRS